MSISGVRLFLAYESINRQFLNLIEEERNTCGSNPSGECRPKANEYFLANIGVDTTENEPLKIHLIFTLWDLIFTEPPRPCTGCSLDIRWMSHCPTSTLNSKLLSTWSYSHVMRVWPSPTADPEAARRSRKSINTPAKSCIYRKSMKKGAW